MAVTAESVVVELLARTDDFERKIGRAANDFDNNMRKVERSSARVQNATRNLGFQFGDFATQVSTGGSVFTAFGQQAGQAAGALADFDGKLGQVGAFLSGPYGAIIFAATTVLGNLALAHLDAGDSAKEQKKAEQALAASLESLDQISGIVVSGQRARLAAARELAQANIDEAKTARDAAKANLQAAQAAQVRDRARVSNFGIDPATLGESGSVARARAEFQRLSDKIAADEARANAAQRFGLADLGARAATDPIERIRQATENKIDQIRILNLSQEETQRRLIPIYKEEEEAIARIAAAAKKARGAGAELRREARAALTAELGRIDDAGFSKALTASLKDQARDRAAGKPVDFATLVRRGSFDTPLTPADSDQLGQGFGVKDVVLDFEKLRETVGDISKIKFIDAESLATGQRFAENLTQTLGQAVIFSGNIGDALVNSLKAAAAEAIGSGLLSILTGGRAGRSFGSTLAGIGSLFGFAGGGPVNAGQVIKINETGQELFRPSVPGRIIPAGQAAMMGGGGGASIVQNLNINFAGNAATREEAATFARIAYEQSLRAFREAGAFGVPSV